MKSKIKRWSNQVFLVFVTLWAGFWLVLFPWAMQNADKRGQAEQVDRECYAEGNSPKQAEDCANRSNADARLDEEFWKFPNYFRYLWRPILVWVIFFPIDLCILCRGLAIYFVWAHP